MLGNSKLRIKSKRWIACLIVPLLIAGCGGGDDIAPALNQVPTGFTRDQSWITGLSSATAFVQAPDGRFFVAQQGGALRVVKNATLLGPAMLNVTVNASGDRGLLGVAVHPNFASNGYVYVYYTSTETNIHNRISRFTVVASTPRAVSMLAVTRTARRVL